MRIIKKVLILILTAIFCSTFLACSKSGSATDFYAFNTIIHVETHDFAMSKQTEDSLNELFTSLSKEFSCNDSSSAVYKLNNSSTNTDIEFSSHGFEVFEIAKDLYSFTSKMFNPAIFPLVKLWQFDDYNYPIQNFTPPSEQDILACLDEDIDFDKVVFDKENATVYKAIDSVKVDFGGILKGYAIDKAKDILLNAGHKSGYINIGGSSLYVLSVNALTVRHPRATQNLSAIISVNGTSLTMKTVSTSGDYEKYHQNDDVRYSHIINPLTGYPTTTGVISATIIGGTGAFGDAVTTALCLMEHEYGKTDSELIKFMNKIISVYPDCMIFAVYDKGGKKEIITNKKQGEQFTLLDSSYSLNQI